MIYESFVNSEVRIHRLEVLRSLIPCVNSEFRIHRHEIVHSLVPFAQGYLVVFPVLVQSVQMPFQAGPSR